MRVLITGICGFVGRCLAEGILESSSGQPIEILGIDNLSRPGSWLNRELLVKRGMTVIHGDVREPSDLEGIGEVDWVIDASANPSTQSGLNGSSSSSRQVVQHNLLSTMNLLELCKTHRACLTLISTSRVYSIDTLSNLNLGDLNGSFHLLSEQKHPGISSNGISEATSTAAPISLYGATKLASEVLSLEYGDAFGFPVWVNRCGVLAGAGQFGHIDQGIFSYWIHSWYERKPLKYFGFGASGKQVRDCLHPRDLA